MRSRKASQDQLAEVARRRLELLSAELAELRPEQSSHQPPQWQAPEPPGPPEAAPPRGPVGDEPGRHAHRSVGPAALLTGWVRDRLPLTLQGGARLSAAHLTVLVAVLVAGVVTAFWWLSRADGGETAVPSVVTPASSLVTVPSSPSAGSGTPSAAAGGVGPSAVSTAGPSAGSAPGAQRGTAADAVGAPAASATGSVVVDVTGKVRHPGIATLPLGARVVDALRAAGGARRGVRLGSLNLARVLADGEQIVVGIPAPQGVAASAASAPTAATGASGVPVPMVNINTAGQAELEQLPGIGPVTAQSILAFRSERGSFSAVDELLEVSGIGDATLAKIAPYVTL